MIVHAPLGAVAGDGQGCRAVEHGGGVAHPETVLRLLCDARIQVVVEDDRGEALRLGRLSREPSPSMLRQLRYRDHECRFPGCGSRRFTQAHHVRWWRHGGRTDLDNLVLTCTFHHKLVHEHGWSLRRETDGTVNWFKPDGTRHRAGPAPPPEEANQREPALSAAGL